MAAIVGAAGAGLAIGTLPNLLEQLAGDLRLPVVPVLVGGAVVGVLALAGAHLVLNRRDGVGIVVFLPPAPGVSWSMERLEAMREHARRQHRAAFTVNIDDLQPRLRDGRERRELVRRVVQARLNEDAPYGLVSVPVAFYLVAGVPDAYELGHELRFQVHERVEVQQTSEESGKTIFSAVRVDSRLRKSQSDRLARRTGQSLSFEERTIPGATEFGHRAALIVEVTQNVGMVPDAFAVASTGSVRGGGDAHRGYVLDQRDPWRDGLPCGSALIVRSSGRLPDKRADYEAAVTHIARRWLAFLDERSEQAAGAVEGVLFCSAPVSVAFALGAVIGRRTRIVPYRRDLAGKLPTSSSTTE